MSRTGVAATFRMPPWVWGGRPQALFENADLHIRKRDSVTNAISVQAIEQYERRRPQLVTALLTGQSKGKPDLDVLRCMADDEVDAKWLPGVRQRVERRPEGDGTLTNTLTFYQVHIGSIPSQGLPAQTETALESLREIRISETGEPVFPDCAVFAIKRSDALLHRIKLASVMTRLEHDPELRSRGPSALKAREDGGEIFASSSALHRGFYLLDAYTAPLTAAMTPAVWAVAAHRGYGAIILSLGRPVAGTHGDAAEPLQTLTTDGADSAYEWRPFDPKAPASAVDWWAEALNTLFSTLSDPVVFINAEDDYLASKHL